MPADTSQTERIRRLRGTIQAVWHAECGICPEGTESLYLSRRFGQMVYYRPDATGAAIAESCCSSAVVPPTPCKPSTVVATQINYTNQFVDSVVVTFEGGPPPILLAPGQSTGIVTGITSYTINCLTTPCVPSTVIFLTPTTVPYILNTFSTPVVVSITNSNLSPITVTLNPGQFAGPYTNVTNYTIACSSVIDITCNLQPPLPSLPNAITFTNRDVSDIVISVGITQFLNNIIILSPGQSSNQFVDITRYTAQCVTPVTLDVTCAIQPVPPPLFNAVTFHNTDPTMKMKITVDISGSQANPLPEYLSPGEFSAQYPNVMTYTIVCITDIPLQCNSSGTIPSGIIQFTNTTSTDMLVIISSKVVIIELIISAGDSSLPLSQYSGDSYTVKCITDISLICTSSGTLTAPNAVRFINTTTDAMVITYESGTALTLTLPPGSTSSILQDVTSYSVTCIPVTNIRTSCNSLSLIPPSPNALTFTNTETLLPITLNTGGTFSTQVDPGATTVIITNVSSYSVSCPALLQISSCTGAQPPVPSGDFIVQNTSTSVISITYQTPKGGSITFILNPGEISTVNNGWLSYTVSCSTTRTVFAACGDSGPLPNVTDATNFYNTSSNMMAIELSNGVVTYNTIVVPANSYSPYVSSPNLYTATCPTPTTIVMACGAIGIASGITRFQNTSAYTMNVRNINAINGGISVAANSYSAYFANFGNYIITC